MELNELALIPSGERNVIIVADDSRRLMRHSVPNLSSDCHNAIEDGLTHEDADCRRQPCGTQIDSLSVVLSVLYCKVIVVFGIALPVTQIISDSISHSLYHGFYIYMYGGSLTFICTLHLINLRNRALTKIANSKKIRRRTSSVKIRAWNPRERMNHYGSFYLRTGAAAFGIGSMVYSGLEFGEYFIMEEDPNCKSVLLAIKPILRIAFSVLQLHFIFLSDNSMDIIKNQVILRFSLGHMLATNLCEWLSVIVEETNHEINHLTTQDAKIHGNDSLHKNMSSEAGGCHHLMSGIFIQEASSYLFPCTIEYSLICAVTLIEMWKDIKIQCKRTKLLKKIDFSSKGVVGTKHRYSVDCTHSQKGLLFGLIFNVYTIITLIIFFALRGTRFSIDGSVLGNDVAAMLIVICETILYSVSLLSMFSAGASMRYLPYCIHRLDAEGSLRLGLDLMLLFKAQIGVYLYHIFSAMAAGLTRGAMLWPDLLALAQTTLQTVFITDAWWRRCDTKAEQKSKPGREMVTFLRMTNFALWVISITEKNRASLRPVQLAFYGRWVWVVITHASMPLAIFYRFHSTICLFEIWKNAYKDTSTDADEDVVFT